MGERRGIRWKPAAIPKEEIETENPEVKQQVPSPPITVFKPGRMHVPIRPTGTRMHRYGGVVAAQNHSRRPTRQPRTVCSHKRAGPLLGAQRATHTRRPQAEGRLPLPPARSPCSAGPAAADRAPQRSRWRRGAGGRGTDRQATTAPGPRGMRGITPLTPYRAAFSISGSMLTVPTASHGHVSSPFRRLHYDRRR